MLTACPFIPFTWLSLDGQVLAERLTPTVVGFQIEGLKLTFFLVIDKSRLTLTTQHKTPDITFQGRLRHFLAATERYTPGQGLYVTGDVSKAALLGQLLPNIRFNWPAFFGTFCQPSLAYYLGKGLEKSLDSCQQHWRQLMANQKEYLLYESDCFASTSELTEFSQMVDTLRDRTDCLWQRWHIIRS